MKIITISLATWGAVISSVALGWNIYIWKKVKGVLKISAELLKVWKTKLKEQNTKLSEVLLEKSNPEDKNIPRLLITLFNTGKRPKTITAIRVKRKKGLKIKVGEKEFDQGIAYIFKDDLPKVLQDGEFHTLEIGAHVINNDFVNIEAIDSNGTEYALNLKEIEKLKKQAEYLNMPKEVKQQMQNEYVDNFLNSNQNL